MGLWFPNTLHSIIYVSVLCITYMSCVVHHEPWSKPLKLSNLSCLAWGRINTGLEIPDELAAPPPPPPPESAWPWCWFRNSSSNPSPISSSYGRVSTNSEPWVGPHSLLDRPTSSWKLVAAATNAAFNWSRSKRSASRSSVRRGSSSSSLESSASPRNLSVTTAWNQYQEQMVGSAAIAVGR